MKNIVLIGFMGTGKSSIGRRLARRLGRPFLDTDAEIERLTGKTVARIFAEEGEVRFRSEERLLCQKLAHPQGLVIATGGGMVMDPENVRLLRAGGVLIGLSADPDVIFRRVRRKRHRPLLRGDLRERIATLLRQREEAYGAAEFTVDTGLLTIDQAVSRILVYLKERDTALGTRELTVRLGPRSYPVIVGAGILADLGAHCVAAAPGAKALVVTNPLVGGLYGVQARESIERAGRTVVWAEMPDGEEYKTLETVAALYDRAFDAGLDRGGLVVALGGGVVGDVAGFVASTYMRGVAFAQVPTTLLAQVDSSVGGKVGVNHPKGKNVIGAFYQPRFVLADVCTLSSLPPREIRAGIAEIIKYGVIRDASFFAWLEENLDRLLALDEEALAEAVYQSCRIKAEVVAADETEHGLRQILNFGHTVGHALESLTGYTAYRHGEAVAAGMVAEARLAMAEGMLAEADYRRLYALVARAGLPVELPDRWAPEEWLEHFTRDKKTRDGRVAFVLPTAIGRVVVRRDLEPEAAVGACPGR